jgi:uncharacterized repeat protein (TIGR01451 family)
LLAGVIPLTFLFIAVPPAAAQSGAVTATMTCSPQAVRPGDVVTCSVTITNNGSAQRVVMLTDILSGGGLFPDTFVLLGNPSTNQDNRQVYGPYAAPLMPASSTPFYVSVMPFQSRAPCPAGSFSATLTNDVNIEDAVRGGRLTSVTATFSVDCSAPPSGT